MSQVLDRLLEAQLQHELRLWQGDALASTIAGHVSELFRWLETVPLEQVATRAQVNGVIERYVIELRVSGGITELSGELSRLVLGSRSTAQTRVDGILTPASYEEFADKIVSLEGVRRELISLVAQSSTFASIQASLLARSLLDWLTPNLPLPPGSLLGGASELVDKLGERLLVPLERRVLELLRTYLAQHRERVTQDIEKRLLDVLSPERLRAVLDELWDGVASMPLSQAFELLGEQDLEDFVVLVHEFWLRYRKSDFFRSISREMVEHVFDKYGQESLPTSATAQVEGRVQRQPGVVAGSAQARARAGAEAEIGGTVGYGKNVSASGTAKVHAKTDADARATGTAAISHQGVSVTGDAAAIAKASTGVKVTGEVNVGDLGVAAGGGARAEALLGTEATGTFTIGKTGIDFGWNLGAAAGAAASANGQASVKLSERDFLSVVGEAGVSAGYVVGSSGQFTMKGGKLILSMGLKVPSGAPVGAFADAKPAINFNPLANIIASRIAETSWEVDGEAHKVLQDPSGAKAKLIGLLKEYSDKKIKNLATDRNTEHYANKDSVQKFVNQCFPTALIKRTGGSPACDQAITEAIRSTILAKPGEQLDLLVERGSVKKIGNQREFPRLKAPGVDMTSPSLEN